MPKQNPLKTTRKRNPPSTAFKPGNSFRFQPGVSGNPSGKAKNELRLVSRALREQLNLRAPDAVARTNGLAKGASWAQCVAASLLHSAARGDVAAVREIREHTEGSRSRHEFGAESESYNVRPIVEVVFVESDGNGHPHLTAGNHVLTDGV